MTAVLVVLVLLAAPVQVVLSTVLFREPLAAPVLPAILVASWAATRRPEETWPAILLPALILGALSEERAGWFLFALLPAPLIASVAMRRFRPRITGFRRRAMTAAYVSAAASAAYGLLLLLGAGMVGNLADSTTTLIASAILSGLMALPVAAAFWPLRPRQRGLFE